MCTVIPLKDGSKRFEGSWDPCSCSLFPLIFLPTTERSGDLSLYFLFSAPSQAFMLASSNGTAFLILNCTGSLRTTTGMVCISSWEISESSLPCLIQLHLPLRWRP